MATDTEEKEQHRQDFEKYDRLVKGLAAYRGK
jgi:hypothetical protein